MFGIIYCYHCIITGKKYIGQTVNESRRVSQLKCEVRDNLHPDNHFHNAMRKYGRDNFVYGIIEETDELNDREIYWIDYYNTMNEGYNSTIGGEGGPMRDDIIKKSADKRRGQKRTPEQRERLKVAFYESIENRNKPEFNQKISESMRGSSNGAFEYDITYENGDVIRIQNMRLWCEENQYNQRKMIDLSKNRISYHRDIISVEKIEKQRKRNDNTYYLRMSDERRRDINKKRVERRKKINDN